MSILAWIVVGLVAGVLASLVMGGTGYGIIGDIVIGIVGAFIGGWLGTRFVGWGQIAAGEFDFRSIGIATVGAIVLLLLGRLVRRL